MKLKKITPNLSVKNVAKTIKFYQNILNFEVRMLVLERNHMVEDHFIETEEYAYAMVFKDDLQMMFLKESTFHDNIPILKQLPMGASVAFYIAVEQIDEFYQQLQEKKIEIVKELTTTWYGLREFYIKDCNGYILAFTEEI